MATYNNILEAVGKTPLIKLNSISQEIQSTIYSKVEYLNPERIF
jgi:cystathionine beta-synthase